MVMWAAMSLAVSWLREPQAFPTPSWFIPNLQRGRSHTASDTDPRGAGPTGGWTHRGAGPTGGPDPLQELTARETAEEPWGAPEWK